MNFGNMGFMEIAPDPRGGAPPVRSTSALPEIGASFGKSIREFKKGISDANNTIREDYRSTSLPQPPAEPVRQDDTERPEPKRLIS